MTNLSANDVLNGVKFKLNEKVTVSPTKHFTVVDAAFSVNPVSGDVNVYLTVDYVYGNSTGTDIINASQLKGFLKQPKVLYINPAKCWVFYCFFICQYYNVIIKMKGTFIMKTQPAKAFFQIFW